MNHADPQTRRLSWAASDPEQRIGFAGGRFTAVNLPLTLICAVLITAGFFAALFPLRGERYVLPFFRQGSVTIAVAIVFFTSWSLTILLLKSLKLRLQRRALDVHVVPPERDFVLSPQTVDLVQERIHSAIDDPRQFVLFNRIDAALGNLRNLGRIGDVAEMFKSQGESDEANLETSYLMVSAFIWAIPVLGFIGTVLGLSEAIGNFGLVLNTATELDKIKGSLQSVTGGLATAFETTLIGLVAALGVQLLAIGMKKSEQEFLDDCSEYCSRQVISRLRLLPLESD
jgi:biopolymer transport protein ExbB/TolQ